MAPSAEASACSHEAKGWNCLTHAVSGLRPKRAGAKPLSNLRRALLSTLAISAVLFISPGLRAQKERWKELNRRVEQLLRQGKYAEAAPLAQRAEKVAAESFGSQSPELATSIHNLALLDDHQGNYAKAESQSKKALAIDRGNSLANDVNVARDFDDLANIYDHWGKYGQAEPLARQALAIDEKALEPNHLNVARDLDSLGSVLGDEGKFTASEPLFKRALVIREKALGPNAPGVAADLDYLAEVYEGEGRFFEAEPLLKRALAIRRRVFGPHHENVAIALNNLAYLYWNVGKYAQAEPLYKQALAIERETMGNENPQFAMGLNNLAELYEVQGRYGEAEPLFKQALAIAEKVEGPDHPDVAKDLNNLAGTYDHEGRYTEAETLFKRVLAIDEKALGPDHPDVATAISNLAVVYKNEGRYEESETLVKESLAIDQKSLGPDHPDVAFGLNELAWLYDHQGKYAQAEPIYKQALAIEKKALGPDNPDVAVGLSNLARVYEHEANYAAAEPLYKQALAIDQKVLGSEHPDVAKARNNLARLYFAWARPTEAEENFSAGLDVVHHILLHQFSYMSERDRLTFLNTVSNYFPAYYSFAAAYHRQSPELAGRMYDLLLWEKGMVANGITTLERRIERNASPEDRAAFEQLKAVRTQVSNLMYMPASSPAVQQRAIEKLQAQANALERQLASRSAAFAENQKEDQASWEEVRRALGPGEAAIEFVRYPIFDGKKWMGTQEYAALVLTQQSRVPAYVPLGSASVLEEKPIEQYRRWTARPSQVARGENLRPSQTAFYDGFWRPLLPALGKAKTVYVAPDGVLDQVALDVVPMPDGKLLMDRYHLRIVDSTRDLLRQRQPVAAETAFLIGDPRFYMPQPMWTLALRSFQQAPQGNGENAGPMLTRAIAAAHRPQLYPAKVNTEMGLDQNCDPLPPPGGTTCPLPGTRNEVAQIANWLKRKQWKVQTYVGRQALEESVETRLAHPRLLVLATHGFFFPSNEQMQQAIFGSTPGGPSAAGVQDPMLLSGLLLAGVDRSRLGLPIPTGADNGILTAYDASTLDLQGTELVVLSACETGLGKVQAGEGVFGLRRAFEEAGAQAVLMSMWSVPAEQTEELMADFIKNWLGKSMSKHEALRTAQEQIRRQSDFSAPYYWGAWVLVGR